MILFLSTVDVAFKIIEVNVTLSRRTEVDQLELCTFANIFLDVPDLASHRLIIWTGSFSDTLNLRE